MQPLAAFASAAVLALVLSGVVADGLPTHAALAMPSWSAIQQAATSTPAPAPAGTAAPSEHGPQVTLAPPPLAVQVPDGHGGYTAAPALTFRCPAVTSDPFGALTSQTGDRTDVTGCPFRVYDDTFSFGNAQIAMNPSDSTQAVFTALHSAPDAGGPTPRSREPGQTHTAFTTYSQGISWFDQPIQGSPGRSEYGESDAVVMDPRGDIYLAYLWNTGGSNETYGSTIGLYKAGTSDDLGTVSNSYDDSTVIEGRAATDPIPRVHLVYVPPYVPPPDLNATGNLTGGPATKEEIGQEAVGRTNHTDERVAAVWLERAGTAPYGPHGYPGWIDAAVTDTGNVNSWSRLPERSLIGPCLDASNPVAWAGQIYVACEVDKGYDHRSRAKIGDIDIWALDPLTGNTTLVAPTYIVGGHPFLAVTADGYFVLATTRLLDQGGASITLASGWYARTWGNLGDVGSLLHQMAGTKPVYDAAVTALSLSDRYKIYALTYMEWQKPSDPAAFPSPPPPPDPANPLGSRPRLTDYRKFLVVGKECDRFPLGAAEMQLGTGIDATNLAAYSERPSVFDDLQDGLVNYREANGEDLWYFAVNDYGAMQYGAVVTAATGSTCAIPPPPLPPPPIPVAQALTVVSPANIVLGSTVGVAASAMVVYLLTVRRRAAVATVAEDK
ncbi:MAG: hypothetical protein ABR562_00915 [Thermoplasmatota archaeon]|nr:hypothetical protein [Halobacteriales archaeon]